MPDIKVTTWNIEHMNKWFTNDATPQIVPAFQTIVDRAAGVLNEIRPEILCVQEGPSRRVEMETFFGNFVDGDWTVVPGETGGGQKPFIVFRDFDGLISHDIVDFNAPAWKYPFLEFKEADNTFFQRQRNFTRLPVEVIFETASGFFSIVCLHLKSKITFTGSPNSTNAATRTTAIGSGLEQRARILQEAALLRDYFQNHPFRAEVADKLLVVGDLNDGPGRDFFETRFFATDVLRRIRGDVDHPKFIFEDALGGVSEADRFTAIFFDRIDRELRHLLLDHILVPPTFTKGTPKVLKPTATVEHTAYLNQNDADWTKNKKPDRNLYPSDHRPASVTIRI